MKIKINVLIFVVTTTLFLATKIVAQEHTNSWLRTTLSIPVTDKIKTDLELQHRRQTDFEGNNLFAKNLMYTFRTWLYYTQNKDVVFATSPFAYFSNYKIIQKEGDAVLKPTNEYRFSVSVELQHELVNKFFIVNKTGIEYRVFEGSVENVVRLRNRLVFKYDVNSNNNVSIGDEIFINASGTNAQHVFDHNRIFTNFSYKLNSVVKLDIGYIYISRLSQISSDLIEENNFYLNFIYTLDKKLQVLNPNI